MKKSILLFIILFTVSVCPVAAQLFDFNWDVGTAFFGGYTSLRQDVQESDFEIEIQALNFRFQTYDGFSFSISPFNLWMSLVDDEKPENLLITVINCTIAYDIFQFEKEIQLMPYGTIYAIAPENLLSLRADFGIMFNWFGNSDSSEESSCNMDMNFVTAKAGFRMNQYKLQGFFDLGINLLVLGMLFL